MPDYAVGPGRHGEHFYGDNLAEDEPPYPADWDSNQRLTAYWYAHGRSIKVRSTEAWRGVLIDAQRSAQRHQRNLAEIRNTQCP
jgi:hypothetical protein